jgi:hypothetical protein
MIAKIAEIEKWSTRIQDRLSGLLRSDIKIGNEGEPDLRGEPAATGAENSCGKAGSLSGLSRSDIKIGNESEPDLRGEPLQQAQRK